MATISVHHSNRLIHFPKILDDRGNLTFMESGTHIPFDIQRVYWIYDVPGGEVRGGHAYQSLNEVVISLSGSFDVVLNDGQKEERFQLNRSFNGIYVPKLIWRQLENFSTNAVALILASGPYDETDYVREFTQFKDLVC